jgi:nucleoid-associated protein Lsr2
MARKVTVALQDDLDGGPADETVRFGFGGTEYEIDLSEENARAFRAQLAPFVQRARHAGGTARRAPRAAAARRRGGEVRAWAREHGIAVSARGRIPGRVIEQYQVAAKGR